MKRRISTGNTTRMSARVKSTAPGGVTGKSLGIKAIAVPLLAACSSAMMMTLPFVLLKIHVQVILSVAAETMKNAKKTGENPDCAPPLIKKEGSR